MEAIGKLAQLLAKPGIYGHGSLGEGRNRETRPAAGDDLCVHKNRTSTP